MNPREEYNARRERWLARKQLAHRSFIGIGNWRLIIAIVAAVLAWLAFVDKMVSAWWLVAPVSTFVVLVVWHQRVLRKRVCAERAIRFYDQALGRLDNSWAGQGSQGIEFQDREHIYADDLDVFGRGGLFELLSSARTAAGERLLANWLLAPASFEETISRQYAVRELSGKLDLREDIALEGEDIKSSVQADKLSAWGAAPAIVFPSFLKWFSLLLGSTGLLALILRFADVWPLWPLVLVIGINAGVMFLYRKQIAEVHNGIEAAAHQLGLLSLLIGRLEHEQFECDGLKRLRSSLMTGGVPASRRIKHLDRWLELLDSSDHVILRILEPLILYKMQIVLAIEAWRTRNGQSIGKWIYALAEFEALSCIGALHFERPSWAFPTLSDSESIHFSAEQLGHPLLNQELAVRNDVTLDKDCRLLIVSGSNMSGKSTLLRAVGLNTALAWAGAPVCAESLNLSLLQVGASIRVSDSLQDNKSRFFAEIQRLRQIVELTKRPIPVLFLLDELLSGTNSHDRRIGAAAVVRGLLASKTIGFITTHDLALAQLDEESDLHARNVHFEDQITDGKIEFDYRLRPGVVTHSNALELMRSIGLQI